ncbi:P-loop containing nucleoside triphosphate hydrolase protein [Mycena sanguinolenta]|uniref:P-loop containing nucleoside triphosphate hydrolase protein n=1 Tax=Mycena sanguinolenta TaxID=230812 RepID=A0A8H7CH55_9AGAR|nr:P-loop containing nucleoside triphosphate hydrolase protein [Mycena sanguinolenta]
MAPEAANIVSLFTVSLTIVYDLTSRIDLPKYSKSIVQSLSSPFQNFLGLEDLGEPVGTQSRRSRLKVVALVGLALLQCASFLGSFVYAWVSRGHGGTVSLLLCLAWGYTALRLALNPPITPPFLSFAFASIQCVVPLVYLSIDVYSGGSNVTLLNCARIVGAALFLWIAGTMPLQTVESTTNIAGSKDKPSMTSSMPEDKVTLWEWSTFSFVEPLFALSNKRTLNDEDVWTLSPYFKHKNLFNKCLEYRAKYPKHSLIRFLLVSNSLDLIIDIVLELWGIVEPTSVSFMVLIYSLKVPLSDSFLLTRCKKFWRLLPIQRPRTAIEPTFGRSSLSWPIFLSLRKTCFKVGIHVDVMKGRVASCSVRFHYKSLVRREMSGKVNSKEEGELEAANANLGKIVNLMQGDSYAVGSCAEAYVVNYPLAKYQVYVTRNSWKAKDSRMEKVNELLQNIRFLKFFGWEYHWSDTANGARETELGWRVKENVVSTLIAFIWTWIPSATALTSFLCYTLIAGQRLTVSKAFTSLALFSALQEPMTALPAQVFAMLHGRSPLFNHRVFAQISQRTSRCNVSKPFLAEDEVPEWASTLSSSELDVPDADIGFDAATFEWDIPSPTASTAARFQLGPLDTIFPKGKLTLVSGATGSGKTATLLALLGEMHCVEGKVLFNKSHHQVAYCAQNPWLEHATIRDNIIFGSAYGYDEARYEAVIEACALVRDLEVFDAGDMTEIGEKGVTLSGGQRARIALARALYSQATCILLDDPLAAVDMHTATHIVQNCLTGTFARDRTIILVTHHISLCLPIAHYLVELSQGKVLRQGTIKSFEESGVLQKVVEAEDYGFQEQEEEEVSAASVTVENEADSVAPEIVKKPRSNGKLIEAEARAEGRVSWRTYMTYIRAAGVWSKYHEPGILGSMGRKPTRGIISFPISFKGYSWGLPWDGLPSPNVNVKPWLMIYLEISLLGAFTVLFYIALGYYASLQASRSLFLSLLRRLTRAPARFFDVTPIGRILNRFTTDINTIDGALQNSARACLSGVLNFIASFSVILAVVPTFAPFALFIAWLYIRLAPSFVRASRDLRRLESISLSPAFAGFDELLRGITHVRAFGMEQRYQDRFYARVDKFQSFDHVYWLVSGWLRWRYDCLGSVVVFATTLFALWMGVTNGAAAIVIVQAGIFAEASRQLVKVAAQLELDFNMENLVVKYAPDLPAVLRNLSFTIKPSEKVGVVGRTGSGKSTLALSLLRMVEPAGGRIIVDGVDISNIGLEDLRTRITIISQDVSLFSGTIRSNLDPLGHASSSKASILDMPVNQGSLSAGERQLVALARAILRRTNIIIMDEATSQIDTHLDDQIQQTIREELTGPIVITIAHRLKTIMDYDRILVLDDGELLEFGSPKILLQNTGGVFREMCRKSPDWPLFAAVAAG